jgi:hypothetical protein
MSACGPKQTFWAGAMGSRATAICRLNHDLVKNHIFGAVGGCDKGLNKGGGNGFLARQKHGQPVSVSTVTGDNICKRVYYGASIEH